ncbi:MAG: carbon storage regulator [Pirellulaceae bacterium]|nr:carbon storage regulator [Pirellulaceae bacterium]
MLVLTRKSQERIQIGENIVLTIVRIQGNSVRVGIEAPKEVRIQRSEKMESAPMEKDHEKQGAPPTEKKASSSVDSEEETTRRNRQGSPSRGNEKNEAKSPLQGFLPNVTPVHVPLVQGMATS